MKNIIMVLIIVSSLTCFAESQISLEMSTTENDQLINRLSSYFTLQNGNWTFVNSTKLKYSEIQENIEDYYQESYIRNLFQSYYFSDKYSVNLRMGIGLSPSDNHMILPEGMNSLIEHQNIYSLGGGFNWDNHKTYLDMDLEYYASEYDKYDLNLTNSEKITEADIKAEIKAGVWISKELLVYLATDHFNDMNDNSEFNYSDTYINLQYDKNINYANHLTQNISFGNSDLNDELPLFMRSKTRLSTRFAPDWTILNTIDYEIWRGDDEEIYLGNSWMRSVIRRNLGITEYNELSYIQAAAQYELDTEIGFSQIAGTINVKRLQLKASEKMYFGENRWLNNELDIGAYWNFAMNNLKLGYVAEFSVDSNEESDLRHNLIVNLEF